MYNVINNVEVKRRRPIWLDQLHTYKHNRCLIQLQQMNGVRFQRYDDMSEKQVCMY